ncbi:MAG: hypothetical protein CTY10_06335 [Methylotenera sp.]|nr:MAG: hypothetical protein CTY10_06335 [Methylotenera sp.]
MPSEKTEGIVMQLSKDNHQEIVSLQLTIGQCRIVESVLDEKLFEIESGLSDFNENAFKALLSVFSSKSYELVSASLDNHKDLDTAAARNAVRYG